MKRILPPFIMICCISLLVTYATKTFITTDEFYYSNLTERLSYEQIKEFIVDNKSWEWLTYLIIPVILILKLSLISLCLATGMFILVNRFEYLKTLEAVILAEMVLLFPAIVKLLWFLFFNPNYTLSDLQYFYPLSAINFFEYQTLEPWVIYPLQILNAFEFVYWFTLAFGLYKQFSYLSYEKAIGIVMSSYVNCLVVWVATAMFFSLMIL